MAGTAECDWGHVTEEALSPANREMGPLISALTVALEGMEQGAVDHGLPEDTARAFVRQTLLGTSLLLERMPGSPAELKDQVASPGGTTISGLAVLEERAVRGAFIRSVEAIAHPSDPSVAEQQVSCRVQDPGREAPNEGRAK